MAFIETTPVGEATETILEMYERQQSSWGFVPNYAKVFSHRPEVLARWGRLLAELRRPMSVRRFELVTFVAAIELRHSACSLAHGQALMEFFTEKEISALASGEVIASLTEGEQIMIQFARQVARDASSVTVADVDLLRKHDFTDAEVFDIAAAVAGRAFFTKLLDALGVQSDATFMQLDESFRETLTVGRPIDSEAVARL
jgi:uncharacterized peroxidase-related enzyme